MTLNQLRQALQTAELLQAQLETAELPLDASLPDLINWLQKELKKLEKQLLAQLLEH